MLARLRERREADPRRANVVVGASDNAIVASVVPDLIDGGFGDVVFGDGSCGDIDSAVLDAADAGHVVVAGTDAVSDASCLHPGVFARCVPPSLSLCAEAAGVDAEAVVIIDEETQRRVERAMLRNATRSNHDQWTVQIGGAIALYDQVFLRTAAPKFIIEGIDREVRFSVDAADERLVWAMVDVPGGNLQLLTFGLMVRSATIDGFLLTHDITPAQCAFDVTVPDGDAVAFVDVDCAKNGATIVGRVLPTESDTSGLVLTAPGDSP